MKTNKFFLKKHSGKIFFYSVNIYDLIRNIVSVKCKLFHLKNEYSTYILALATTSCSFSRTSSLSVVEVLAMELL